MGPVAKRYYQTLARLLSGMTTLAFLAWFLWPRDSGLLDREEPLFAFLVALSVWILTEFKESDEVVFRSSTKNDIRLAREMNTYASDQFRTLLGHHDHYSPLPNRYLSEASMLVHEIEVGTTFFQDKRVQKLFVTFGVRLKQFTDYYGIHSAQYLFAGDMKRSIIPGDIRGTGRDLEFKAEIDEANRLANEAWKCLLPLVALIKERVPEAYDEPICYEWFRS